LDDAAYRFLAEADTDQNDEIMVVAHRPRPDDTSSEYAEKEREQRLIHQLTSAEHVLFLEMSVGDASEFSQVLEITGHQIGNHRVLRGRSSTVPNAIAAFLLHVQEEFGKQPHCYFGWTEGSPAKHLLRYVLFGEGDTAPITREVLRKAEPDVAKRPAVHVGG
jgi:hypothetical protein